MTTYLCESRPRRHAGRRTAAPREKTKPWSNCSDEDLLREYTQKATREAFEELVHRYERPLYSYLHGILGDANLAEDAFQAAFLEVYLHCRQFDPARRFRPWVYRIANRAGDRPAAAKPPAQTGQP